MKTPLTHFGPDHVGCGTKDKHSHTQTHTPTCRHPSQPHVSCWLMNKGPNDLRECNLAPGPSAAQNPTWCQGLVIYAFVSATTDRGIKFFFKKELCWIFHPLPRHKAEWQPVFPATPTVKHQCCCQLLQSYHKHHSICFPFVKPQLLESWD